MSRFFADTPIAILGLACRLPGARDLEAYWQLLVEGRSAIVEVPPERLDRELYYDPSIGTVGKTYSTLAGLVPPVSVEPQRLRISAELAARRDPAHLTMCDLAAEALRHARLDPFQLPTSNAGVFIGNTRGSPWSGQMTFAMLIEQTAAYLRELPSLDVKLSEQVAAEIVREVRRKYGPFVPLEVARWPDLASHVGATMIAQTFGLTGPAMVVDAACASSLQALLLGINALQQGRLELAVVGGASHFKADTLIQFSHAQSVSAHGSRPFDADADGLIIGEGSVMMVLKTLARALRDGDPVQAVIRGLGMSTDGRGKSLWAPRKEGQILAIQRAYTHGLEVGRVQYIEAHATSTQIGDATELAALHESLAGRMPAGHRIALGACKANVGHCLENAGLAGLAKTVLAVQHATIPPTINLQRLNPNVDWDQSPFYVPVTPTPWPDTHGQPKRAGVNAFGVGGLNVHVVLDEFLPAQPTAVYFASVPAADVSRAGEAPDQQLEPPPVVGEDRRETEAARAKTEPIAIIGLGAIYPGARTVEQFWHLLQTGEDPKSDVPAERWPKELGVQPGPLAPWRTPLGRGGFIRGYQYDWSKNRIPPKQVEQANPLQFMLLDAAEQALAHAGYDRRPFDRTRVGAVVGTVFGGDFAAQLQMGLRLPEFQSLLAARLREHGLADDQISTVVRQYQELFFRRMPALLDETGSFTSSTLASRITKTFDLMGGAFSLDAGSNSSLAALIAAVDILRSGDCEMILCAAGQRSMDLSAFVSLAWSGALASGGLPGEGVGVLLLKRLSDARRDGDPIQAVIREVGVSFDAQVPTAARQTALHRALGGEPPPAPLVAVESAANQFGHCGAADGMASLLKATGMCRRQESPLPPDSSLVVTTTGSTNGFAYAAVVEPAAPASVVVKPRPRVAWMFPGQGSQYAGMLEPLIHEFPPAAEAMRRADQALARWGRGTFADLAWRFTDGLGVDVWQTQAAVLVANYIVAESLAALGVRPHVVAGLSFGEIAALVAAGAWSLETALRVVGLRTEAFQAAANVPGGMVAVTAPRAVVEQLVAEDGGMVYIANHNAPEQFVLSGEVAALVRVVERAQQIGLHAVRLNVPCAFHCPMMAPARAAITAALPAVPVQAARVPVLSTAFNRYMLEEDDLRRSLCEQFTLPVPYVGMVQKLAAEHPTVFVEIGPQRVLTKLHRKILGEQALGIVSTDDPERHGLAQLQCVVALLRDCGVMAGEAAVGTEGQPLVPGKLTHFDATERRRQSRRQQATVVSPTAPPAPPPPSGQRTALQKFLVQFIVEQTGYPEEMVDLDANLEADLGIDSIKKAQLFGEIQEEFRIAPPAGNVTLDDFPTLRSVLKFLADGAVAEAVPGVEPDRAGEASEGLATRAAAADVEPARIATVPEADRRMRRHVLRMVPSPLAAPAENWAWGARAAILGDNPAARALADELQHHGVRAVLVADLPSFERAWQDGPLPQLFLLTPRDGAPMPYADAVAWDERRERGVMLPFAVCQKWFELATAGTDSPALVAVTALGGDFGNRGELVSAESGGLAGLVKAAGAESQGGIRVKVLDFPAPYPAVDLARAVIAEVASQAADVEVGYDAAGTRHVLRAEWQRASTLPSRAAPPGGAWVVTGGGRGVTAYIARELGKQWGLVLHLLGSSPPPAIDPQWRQLSADGLKQLKAQLAQEARQKGEAPGAAWQKIERALELDRTLRAFADAGVRATYHQCDVADRVRLAAVLAEIGPVEGVIHGAGVEHACRFSAKTLPLVAKTIAAKVDGAAALMAALDAAPPRYFLGFGSVSGRYGGIGQTDYSLANDMLCKLLAQYRRTHPGCTAVCFDWTAWAEVGMAARPESRFALEAMGIQFMPPAEGAAHIADELCVVGTDAEVLIVDDASRLEARPVAPAATPPPALAAATAGGYDAGFRYGQEHRAAIRAFLREYADRFPDRGPLPVPAVMGPVASAATDDELRGMAAGAGVALVSLHAHHAAVRRGQSRDTGTPGMLPVPPLSPGDDGGPSTCGTEASEFPLVAAVQIVRPGQELNAAVELCPQSDPFLRDHRIYDRSVLPGAVTAEILAEAASLLEPGRVFVALSDVDLLKRLDFHRQTPQRMNVLVRGATCELQTQNEGSRIVVATGQAHFADAPLPPEVLEVGEPAEGWRPFVYPEGWRLMSHGDSLRTLLELNFQHDGGLARLVAKAPLALAGARRGRRWLVPSALLDGCLVACGSYSYRMIDRRVELPRRIGRLQVYRQPRENEACRLRLFCKDSRAEGTRYDFHLVGEDGRAVLTVTDYETVCLKTGKAKA